MQGVAGITQDTSKQHTIRRIADLGEWSVVCWSQSLFNDFFESCLQSLPAPHAYHTPPSLWRIGSSRDKGWVSHTPEVLTLQAVRSEYSDGVGVWRTFGGNLLHVFSEWQVTLEHNA